MRTVHNMSIKHYCGRLCVTLALMLIAFQTHALTLKEAVALALHNDPTFLAAQANLNVSRERADQALAGLFPQLTISASTTDNRRHYAFRTDPTPNNIPSGNYSSGLATPAEHFNSNSAQLNFTQPLWRRSSVIAMTQSDLVVEQADYQLKAAAQDMLVRLAQAWFDVMQARDEMMVTAAQVQTAQQQLEFARRGLARGVISLTEKENARAKHEQAIAEHAMAQSGLEIKLAALEQIIGPAQHTPPVLANGFKTSPSGIGVLKQWLTQAESDNPSLLAALRGLDAANEEIRKQRAGHDPTLDLVASYGNSAQGAGISGGQYGFDSRLGTVGLQLNMPLYSGGGQSAKVREAMALRDKAAQELEAARRAARLDTKQSWFTWRASQVREAAAGQAVQSAMLALKGTQSARKRGVKSDADVMQAQQQYAIAQRDWRKARYDAILSRLKLKAACGQLNGDDLVALDEGLVAEAN